MLILPPATQSNSFSAPLKLRPILRLPCTNVVVVIIIIISVCFSGFFRKFSLTILYYPYVLILQQISK